MIQGFSTDDTIVAIATPQGRGGIGVVRVAGPDAPRIASSLTGLETLRPRHATFVRLLDPREASLIDQVVVTWFQAPHSFTGDDVVEFSAHGSPAVLQRIVELVHSDGARLAEPGEFTFRAYLNGRIDLVQAEAVADLVNAVTPMQARVAVDQLEGTLTARVGELDRRLFDLAAKLEASLDFPEEGFHFITRDEASRALRDVADALDVLLRDSRRGRLIREGRIVVIAGRPNVGKSSLFNALLGANRAIVTAVAGTTRDALTEVIDLDGIPVTLVDTAGVRETVDDIEAEGVRRAREALDAAALVLLVLDGSLPLTPEDQALLADISKHTLVVINKSDQPDICRVTEAAVRVSALTGEGLDDLRREVARRLADYDDARDTPALSNQRHVECAEQARSAVGAAIEAIDAGAAEEVVLAELHEARTAFELLTGRRTPDDVLTHIFSHFCVGK